MRTSTYSFVATFLGLVFAYEPSAYTGASNAICTTKTYSIPLSRYSTIPFSSAITENPSQAALTDRIVRHVTSVGNFTEEYMAGTNSSSGTYALSGTLCVPKAGDKHNGTIQLLVHGIAWDSTYWDLSYQPENYSYVYAATAEGYTTFNYDRLGTGKSDHPDGYHIVQTPTDLEILLSFISLLHEGKIGDKTYEKIVGVGHSYGSILLTAASAVVPDQLSALVLTGYSANGSYIPQFQTSSAFARADATYPSSFSGLSGEYMVLGVPQATQTIFYYYPYYDPSAAEVQWQTAQPVTMGVVFTLPVVAGTSSSFTGPVHVVTGDRDWVFCGNQCDIRPDGEHTILELVQPYLYPNSSDFSVYSPANTGHGINTHYTAPESYANIMAWLKAIKY